MPTRRGVWTRFRQCTAAAAICLPLTGAAAHAQIVDTLAGFDDAATGVSGALAAGVAANGGNTETVAVSGSARIQWHQGAERIRFLSSGTYETAGGVSTEEDLFVHLRHNHRFQTWVRSLAFVQLQRNPFQRLQSRTLLGVGSRFEPVTEGRTVLAIGAAYMLELEQILDESGTATEHRLSSFVNVSSTPRDGVTIESTVFVQPRLDAFDDVRVSGQASLRSQVVGPLSLVVTSRYVYDRNPPERVEREDWTVKSSLQLAL